MDTLTHKERKPEDGFATVYVNRRHFLRTVGFSAASVLAGSTVRAKQNRDRPNIVLIMADDFGYEVPTCNGGESYQTPNLDRLAETGIRFTHCYSTPKCVPSRVNILTGRYGFRTGQEWGYIPPDEVTFGHVLSDAGYATALAGKWQLALIEDNPDHVAEMGFAENCCWAWHEGPRYWQPMIRQNGALRNDIKDCYGPDVFTEFLIDFMKRNKDRPFMAYYPMVLTHFAKTGGKYKESKGPDGRYQSYPKMVRKADEMVGRIVDALDDLGLREQTLVMFTGDNGTPKNVVSRFKGGLFKGGKGDHTDAGTHVPLIADWPGTAPAGTVCDDLIDFSDFLPTLADLADAPLPDGGTIDGRSFAPQLRGCHGSSRDWAYTEWKGKAWARTKRWKLYRNGELYDVKDDPHEKDPVPVVGQSAEVAAARKRLQAVLKELQ